VLQVPGDSLIPRCSRAALTRYSPHCGLICMFLTSCMARTFFLLEAGSSFDTTHLDDWLPIPFNPHPARPPWFCRVLAPFLMGWPKSGCAKEAPSRQEGIQAGPHPPGRHNHAPGWLASGTEAVEGAIEG
jgi:hypothetical protein